MRSIYDNAINRLEKAEKHSVLHTLKLDQTAILVHLKIGTFWTMKKSCFKRWISKSERTHWLIIRPKFLLWSHYTSGACFAFLWSAPGAGGAQTNQRFIFCCLWYIWENPFITRDLTLHFSQMLQLHEWEHQQFKQYSLPYNIDLDHELQNVATSCFKAAALSIFQRGHFTTCSSRGRRDVNTREF